MTYAVLVTKRIEQFELNGRCRSSEIKEVARDQYAVYTRVLCKIQRIWCPVTVAVM